MRLVSLIRRTAFLIALGLSACSASCLSAQAVPMIVSGDRGTRRPGAEISASSVALAACIAALPPDQLRRTTMYLHATVSGSDNSALTAQADLMAEQVSDSLRSRMGGTSTLLPNADSLVTRLSVPAELFVTLHQDGSATRVGASQYGDTLASALLAASFDAVRKHGDGIMVWPDGYRADSVVVALVLWPIDLVRETTDPTGSAHPNFAVFDALAPILRPALPRSHPDPRYPFQDRIHHVSGLVLLRFVVDTAGQAVPGTVRDVWPADKPRLTGELGSYYDEFVAATKDAVAIWKFYPASLGSCPISQIVQLPVQYKFR